MTASELGSCFPEGNPAPFSTDQGTQLPGSTDLLTSTARDEAVDHLYPEGQNCYFLQTTAMAGEEGADRTGMSKPSSALSSEDDRTAPCPRPPQFLEPRW